MSVRGLLALIIGTMCVSVAAFLVVWGAVNNKPELVAAGMTVIGASLGSLITYLFTKQTIDELRRGGK